MVSLAEQALNSLQAARGEAAGALRDRYVGGA